MTERLLQFIWQFQYFNGSDLRLVTGEDCRILFQGLRNADQGPDFLDARISMGQAFLAGPVELHTRSSDWKKHGHDEDPNYKNIILHVVWEYDGRPSHLPTLVLQDRVAKWLLHRYEEWMKKPSFIPCEHSIGRVDGETWSEWKARLLSIRLQRKATLIQSWLVQNKQHWEETIWWLLARNFGLRVNADVFEAIARSLPLTLIRRHAGRVQELEALLLGQAGLLKDARDTRDTRSDRDTSDAYFGWLRREYLFLKTKYRLPDIHGALHTHRMRPGNFPALRLAQLAALIGRPVSWLALLKEAHSASELKGVLSVAASAYWDRHYSPGRPSFLRPRTTGPGFVSGIVINTMAPAIFAYGHLRKDAAQLEKALRWLHETGAERNNILSAWRKLGIHAGNAGESQALIELKTRFCDGRNCLECRIGRELLRPGS